MTTADPGQTAPPPGPYTQRQAAALCGVSVDTIERDRAAGRFPGAFQDRRGRLGAWLIPHDDLVAAGRYIPESSNLDLSEQIELLELRAEVMRLREALTDAQAELRTTRGLLDYATRITDRLLAALLPSQHPHRRAGRGPTAALQDTLAPRTPAETADRPEATGEAAPASDAQRPQHPGGER